VDGASGSRSKLTVLAVGVCSTLRDGAIVGGGVGGRMVVVSTPRDGVGAVVAANGLVVGETTGSVVGVGIGLSWLGAGSATGVGVGVGVGLSTWVGTSFSTWASMGLDARPVSRVVMVCSASA
jgi:hypothetical protein